MKEDLTAMIMSLGPAACVQFSLPAHLRMPFRHMFSFFWTAYISLTRGAVDPKNEENVILTDVPEMVTRGKKKPINKV